MPSHAVRRRGEQRLEALAAGPIRCLPQRRPSLAHGIVVKPPDRAGRRRGVRRRARAASHAPPSGSPPRAGGERPVPAPRRRQRLWPPMPNGHASHMRLIFRPDASGVSPVSLGAISDPDETGRTVSKCRIEPSCQFRLKISHLCRSKISHFELAVVPPDAVLGCWIRWSCG